MERDLIAALQAYGMTPIAGPEDAAKAREVLRAAVRTTLYLAVTTWAPPQATQTVPAAPTTPPHAAPVFQAAPQVKRTHRGPPGACFTCGMFGHWSKDCATAASMQQQLAAQMLWAQTAEWPQAMNVPQAHTAPASVASAPPPPPHGGGVHTGGGPSLYTAHTTGRQYYTPGPRPYPCNRCQSNH